MAIEHVQDRLLVVLAGDRQQESTAAQAEQRRLKILEHIARIIVAQLDLGRSVVSQHATPQRVVQIEHQAFGGRPQQRRTARASPLASGTRFSELTPPRAMYHVFGSIHRRAPQAATIPA